MLNAKQIAETFFDRVASHDNAVADLFAPDIQWNLPGDNSYDHNEPVDTNSALSALFRHLWPNGAPAESRALGTRLMISDRQVALFGQISEKSSGTSKRKIHDVAFHLIIENGAIRHLHMYEDVLAAIVAFDLMDHGPAIAAE
ncbi:hypothetical protein TH25_19795 [Thalassospira profundimaris]|uniref:SnoaL-like domain-containing protein n=1 Tax=Thalassospira profundimaris TaxID=502049 RepID=A0A367WUG7_9PROT|nr:nuclear transport factor 2 family protein [Thalassospira profundimaris]RCK44161.1 hypothetical protein TH25_19795 [Thalassospira profundimaris]